jgi:hypothetical protein
MSFTLISGMSFVLQEVAETELLQVRSRGMTVTSADRVLGNDVPTPGTLGKPVPQSLSDRDAGRMVSG